MLKKYNQSGKLLSHEQLKVIKAGSDTMLPPPCQVNADCGNPYCTATVEELCWVCTPTTHRCIFVY